jgi:hypothetical protein
MINCLIRCHHGIIFRRRCRGCSSRLCRPVLIFICSLLSCVYDDKDIARIHCSTMNGNINGIQPSFTLKDAPTENFRPLKVRVIGAGYSGIYLGIRIPQRLRNADFQIYKNKGIGGTWWENRYPGCACDIPCKHNPPQEKISHFV